MEVLSAIIVAVVVAGVIMVANWLLFEEMTTEGYGNAAAAGAIVGLVNYFAPKAVNGAAWLAPVFLIVMIGVQVMLMYLWHKEGSDMKEAIPFFVLLILFFFNTKAVAVINAAMITNAFFKSVVNALPLLIMIAAVGYLLYDWLRFKEIYEEAEDEEEGDEYEE